MVYTKYHSKYYATQLTLCRASNSIDKLASSLSNAKVDLNPHQIDAALFAFRSPLSSGALLADEVGLGKTIEAGIVISQKWAERNRNILLIVPSSLRKQWFSELDDKFFIKSLILEKKSFDVAKKSGNINPFDNKDNVIICSYNFAAKNSEYLKRVNWNVVVIDEAHRLRNVYKQGNVIANKLKEALKNRKKLLLTATPLQNNLKELYGLSSIIDDYIFGNLKSFQEQYIKIDSDTMRNSLLRRRLQQFCKRTLRKQVTEYVPYTKRLSIVQEYYPGDDEEILYEGVSDYLMRENLHALPASQRKLMTLVLRKLLASSTYAISGTLLSLIHRLDNMLNDVEGELETNDFDIFDEVKDEWNEDVNEKEINNHKKKQEIIEELNTLKKYYKLASEIKKNTKGDNLLTALEKAFEKGVDLGAQKKAVIFTESKRTQQYLFDLLQENGYRGNVLLINGENTDEVSKCVYKEWVQKHQGEDTITGSKQADMKSAIVEKFRDSAEVLIATEAASEGINLQFCSLVVNFDLPWNPQRIEQRIGRCHRYGQKCDVVVVNFVNKRNEADMRVYKLLSEKFQLFDGIFGASDQVLGTLESGIDFEKRIVEIYQNCRTAAEIKDAFDDIQKEYENQINNKIEQTRKSLLENFDEEVQQKLKICEEETKNKLTEYERWLLRLIKSEYKDNVKLIENNSAFEYDGNIFKKGYYNFNWKKAEEKNGMFIRSDHPLAKEAIYNSLNRYLKCAELNLYYSQYGNKISFYENLKCKSGYLIVEKITYQAFEKEEFLIFVAMTDCGEVLDEEMGEKLLELPSKVIREVDDIFCDEKIENRREELLNKYTQDIQKRNIKYYQEECEKLDDWAEDLKQDLESEIKEMDKEIKEMKRNSKGCTTLEETINYQKNIKLLEKKRNQKRKDLYVNQDEIDSQRDQLVDNMEKQLKSKLEVSNLFKIRWNIL